MDVRQKSEGTVRTDVRWSKHSLGGIPSAVRPQLITRAPYLANTNNTSTCADTAWTTQPIFTNAQNVVRALLRRVNQL